MSSYRAMNGQGEHSLEWTVSHDTANRYIVGTPLARARLRETRETLPWLYALALLCLVSLMAFLYLALASFVASEMETTGTLEATIQSIKEANNKLRLDIVLKEDLARVQQEARAMGFVTPQHVECLEVVIEETSTQPAVTSDSSDSSPMTDTLSTPSWWDGLIRQFRDWVADVSETDRPQ